ncbi:WD repeat-containing protein 36 [Anopheles ziemanni]|uniref:WD repeat-containing protein 36 n=1 Tax=Anopheles coustani TaxID=139045 RepID=UPI00265AA8BB|nr:WD repeat-containing protein 36 [Anopheles coustani]XP_058173963.1 WD repeat-containing protein 36 [Anopheles ziemanni]
MRGSHIFQPNRALGYVSNHIPPNVRYIDQRRENIVITCVGRSFHVYGCNSFRLIRAGRIHPENITALAADGFLTYVAVGNQIYGWRSSVDLRKVYRGHEKPVHLLLPFAKHLISVDESSLLKIWVVSTQALYLEIPFANNSFQISALVHPASYKNKILLGSAQGGLQLWNLKTSKLVHKFKCNFQSKVLQLEQAPAIDVIAVGLHNGRIILLNLKYEKVVMEVHQDWGPVTGISFRTDGTSIMATGSSNGQVVFWDLEEKAIVSTLVAHDDSVTGVHFLPNEPLLVTSSPDNSLKMWIFDLSDGGARLLRIREGHAAPPTCIRFHGAAGRHILSSAEDSSLRIFNTVTETLNASMGKASYNRKASKKQKKKSDDPFRMPQINYFTSETTRDKEWDSIAALHQGLVQVTTWSFDKRRMGELHLVPAAFQNKSENKDFSVIATCLCLSHCGNFVTIGYSSGHVERFNIQSGIHRASYGSPTAHREYVRGLASDNLNQFVVSGAADGLLKFWHFKQAHKTSVKIPVDTVDVGEPITLLRSHRESAMVCAALDDFTVLLVDLDTRAVVRRFQGHRGTITDACFSPDSRWLVTAGQDCTVKIWDIPSSYLIDHFRVTNMCTSLTMSPTGDFLATAHVDYRGVNLWANKSLFSHVTLRGLNPEAEAPLLDLPTTICEEQQDGIASQQERSEMDVDELEDAFEEINLDYNSPPQLSSELITMSDLAASRWQNLLNLDIIKKRNRPRQAPQKPESAPFFLPTVAGLDFGFDLNASNQSSTNGTGVPPRGQGRIIRTTETIDNLTPFGKLLHDAIVTEAYGKAIAYLMNLGPTMVDLEIRSLTPLYGGSGSFPVMTTFMRMIISMFEERKEFELAQSYLSVFLKQHGRAIVQNRELSKLLPELEKAQSSGWSLLEDKLLYGLGVVSNLRNYSA